MIFKLITILSPSHSYYSRSLICTFSRLVMPQVSYAHIVSSKTSTRIDITKVDSSTYLKQMAMISKAQICANWIKGSQYSSPFSGYAFDRSYFTPQYFTNKRTMFLLVL